MALAPGTRLGVYDIAAQIGEGGMGAVHRATDTTLGRQVAIKVLPDAFAQDAERLARFEREARTLAALNHPNIATIYAIEKSGGATALVMELVDGEDLSERIARGALPLDDALPIAKQVAEALEAAHEQGIIHRDLKPANIKVREDGTVKVLDFGLAKMIDRVGQASGAVTGQAALPALTSPTLTSPAMTQAGVLLGTAAYMAPEQARGRGLDKRADIWSFGCVLFEMVTGTRAFPGDDIQEVFLRILQTEPNPAAFPEAIPPHLRTLITRCLAKEPRQRVRDVGDVRLALDGAFAPLPVPSTTDVPRRRSGWPLATAGTTALAAVGLLLAVRQPAPSETVRPVVTFDVALPQGMRWPNAPSVAVSPDGRKLAIPVVSGSDRYLLVRDVNSAEIRRIKNRPTAFGTVAWSPDGRLIVSGVNGANGGLLTIDPDTGLVQDIAKIGCSEVNNLLTRWPLPDRILFTCGLRSPISQLTLSSGQITTLTSPSGDPKDRYHSFPTLLPDGRSLLYTRRGLDRADDVSVIRDAAGNDAVASEEGNALYESGYLLFPKGAQLYAQAFDLSTRHATGNAHPLGIPFTRMGLNQAVFGEGGGTLASIAGVAMSRSQFVTLDAQGRQVDTFGTEGDYGSFDITPGGDRLVANTVSTSQSLWVLEAGRKDPRRLTFDDQVDVDPVIGADDMVYFIRRNGRVGLYRVRFDGGVAQPLKSEVFYSLNDIARDGAHVTYRQNAQDPTSRLAAVSDDEERVLVQAKAPVDQVHLAPDSRWVAYNVLEAGRQEVFVASTSIAGAKWLVSAGGGVQPIWSGDGRTLYYLGLDGTLYSVDVDGSGEGFKSAAPRPRFKSPIGAAVVPNIEQFRVTADDQRFVFKVPIANDVQPPVRVVVNWTGLVK